MSTDTIIEIEEADDGPPIIDLDAPAKTNGKPVGKQSGPAELEEQAEEPAKPRKPRPRKKAAASEREVTGSMASILPESEKLNFYKLDLGSRSFIRSYSPKEVAKLGSAEAFIQRYLMPKHGDGGYEIDAINKRGAVFRTAEVSVLDPEGKKGGAMDDAVRSMMDDNRRREDRLVKQLDDMRNKPQPSMAEQMQQFSLMKESLFGSDKPDPMSMMMLMEQMKPKDDGRAASLQSELERLRAERHQASSAPMPLPLPAPANGAGDIVDALLKAAPLLKEIFHRPPPPPAPTMADQMQQIMMMREAFAAPPQKSLAEQATELSALKGIFGGGDDGGGLKGALKAHEQIEAIKGDPPNAESMWDFFNNLVNKGPDIIEAIRQKAEDKKAALAAQHEAQQPRQLEPAPTPQDVPAPEGFAEKMQLVEDAENSLERVLATVEALQLLHSEPAYRAFVDKILGLTMRGEQEKASALLNTFLEECRGDALLTQAAATATLEAFEEHFETVGDAIKSKMGA